MSDRVIVVTNVELGWDNVVGVFSGMTVEELRKRFKSRAYVIQEHTVYTNTSEFE